MDLNGAVAIVTGGNGGLGQRICHSLAGAGCNLAIVYSQSIQEAEAVAGNIIKTGVQVETIQCDVSDPRQVSTMVATVQELLGSVDILVNDAAYNKWIPFADLDAMTYDEWSKILDVNLTGPMLCMKSVAPVMIEQGTGRIVNIASVAGLAPMGSSIPYAVSKAGLIHLTRCMAVSLAPSVLVNCVAPGYIEGTRATSNLEPEYQDRAKTSALLKRAASKDDIARQVVEFCRTDSITGQTLVVDSGRFFH